MLFRNFRVSGPSRVPILRIFGIYVISGRFPRRKRSPILRPGKHFAPDFGVWIFDDFSRRHFSELFCVFGVRRCPEASLFETCLMTFP